MPNVLTDLAADIYKAADTVGREINGFIPSVTINANGSERVAVGDSVRSHFTRAATAVNIAESMTVPEGTDQTIDNKTATITKARSVQIPWTGENIKSVNNGSGFDTIFGDQIAQAMRTLTNEIEIDLAVEAYTNASRAVGVAGTTPFASTYNIVNNARQIIVDNGGPAKDGQLSLVMNTIAGTNVRNLSNLQKVNEAGSDQMLRQGTLLDISGIMLKESAGISAHTIGTGTGYLLNDAASTIGDTAIEVDTGSGTVLVGDIITFAADTTNKYVVNTALVGTELSIGTPGLRAAIADSNAITVGATYTPNVLMHRSALELISRAPAVPEGGDIAVDAMLMQDPHSGLVFEIRVYKGYRKTMIEVAMAWGFKAWKPDNIVVVMG